MYDDTETVREAIELLASESSGAIRLLADAILPIGTFPGHDAAGGHVASLTEAVMGMTCGLMRIAEAIELLAGSITIKQ